MTDPAIQKTNIVSQEEVMDAQTTSVKRPNEEMDDNNNEEETVGLGKGKVGRPRLENQQVTPEGITVPTQEAEATTDIANEDIEVEDEACIIIELGEKAVSDNLHIDRGAFLELLRHSPFNGCHTGKPQFQVTRKRILINLIRKEDLATLLLIDRLELDGENWPIVCKKAERATQLKFGVIKIHPQVSENSIKEDLLRNGEKVEIVQRITKREGPTYSVKLSFKDNVIPEVVMWGGELMKVHKYNPGVLICNKCSKGGHLAKYCNAKSGLKCPLCAGNHGKDLCKLKNITDTTQELCKLWR